MIVYIRVDHVIRHRCRGVCTNCVGVLSSGGSCGDVAGVPKFKRRSFGLFDVITCGTRSFITDEKN